MAPSCSTSRGSASRCNGITKSCSTRAPRLSRGSRVISLGGGVVPHLFVKTKAITHGLVGRDAERPPGWSTAFAERVREIVLPGYTVFSSRDAHMAARRMLARGPIRLKKRLSASGKNQTVVGDVNELDAGLEKIGANEMATYGLVLEENLRQVRTLS